MEVLKTTGACPRSHSWSLEQLGSAAEIPAFPTDSCLFPVPTCLPVNYFSTNTGKWGTQNTGSGSHNFLPVVAAIYQNGNKKLVAKGFISATRESWPVKFPSCGGPGTDWKLELWGYAAPCQPDLPHSSEADSAWRVEECGVPSPSAESPRELWNPRSLRCQVACWGDWPPCPVLLTSGAGLLSPPAPLGKSAVSSVCDAPLPPPLRRKEMWLLWWWVPSHLNTSQVRAGWHLTEKTEIPDS